MSYICFIPMVLQPYKVTKAYFNLCATQCTWRSLAGDLKFNRFILSHDIITDCAT
jgi:hypothetical protein